MSKELESPCIRHCCLDDNDICVGCFRHLSEILVWAEATDAEKEQILEKCSRRKKERDNRIQP
ncbi:putative Fe-S protein YdhL (DUF1289 family) [Alteromonadaceae bacterium 2753L.S.0a.02]|nr:putative Fe-S protein YdhL (DUF1289 family) [Alteromonadaceae bacterium 2753L.S.0a.02]